MMDFYGQTKGKHDSTGTSTSPLNTRMLNSLIIFTRDSIPRGSETVRFPKKKFFFKATMPRKSRKRKQSGSVGKKRVQTKKKRKARVSARDQKIAKIVVDSLWRVKTADKETTSTGKEVLSGWQRCRIVERLDANESVRECQLSTQLTTSYGPCTNSR